VLPSGLVLWNQIGNAAGALTLANGTNATTFNQTSAVNWKWANTTAATFGANGGNLIAKGSTGSASTVTLNTVGATLLVAVMQAYAAAPSISDSASNTWNYLSSYIGNGSNRTFCLIAYAYSNAGGALVTSATDLFTVTAAGGSGPSAVVYAFSNTLTTSAVYDSSNGVNNNGATLPISMGSLTPTAGDVVVVGLAVGGSGPGSTAPTISGAVFSSPDTANIPGDGVYAFGAYLLNASGATLNSTWNYTNTQIYNATASACFKSAGTVAAQSSPIHTFGGQYWNGSASAPDTWTIQDVIGNATNGTSTLTIAQSGSAGTASVSVPNLNVVGTVISYDGNATVKAGIPSILAAPTKLTGQQAAQSAVSIVASAAAGMWRISYVAYITQVDTVSSVLGGVTGFAVNFTDPDDSVAKTSNPTTPTISAGNTTGTTISGNLYVYAKVATAITYNFGYTTTGSGATAMSYSIAVYAEYLG